MGGQVGEEGLTWLVDGGFKTIVDLRFETIKDKFYQVALNDAISFGKVELIRFLVEVGTTPSMEQVEKFASLVSDCNQKPIYLHSKEGVWGTSTMVSRWWQYMTYFASQFASDRLSQDANGSEDYPASSSTEKKFKLQETNELLQEASNVIHSSKRVN
ncbi:hypothetical protein PVK06_040167 [Gossypium arboreum]|uniref:DSP-PTPase phosphatase fused to NAD+ Kinase domain-containing protein n=1 Tax=Gossypium arboreum TaxID=29729 RepID=A0ABR0N515_GOSAR|nr:hypothetical protein PVK06_040167 [Gossypium arboreum]